MWTGFYVLFHKVHEIDSYRGGLVRLFVCPHVTSWRLLNNLREPFAKFVDWWQCAAVIQRKAVTVMPSCSGGNVVVA
jgi:hypothetical protein